MRRNMEDKLASFVVHLINSWHATFHSGPSFNESSKIIILIIKKVFAILLFLFILPPEGICSSVYLLILRKKLLVKILTLSRFLRRRPSPGRTSWTGSTLCSTCGSTCSADGSTLRASSADPPTSRPSSPSRQAGQDRGWLRQAWNTVRYCFDIVSCHLL